MFEDVKIIGWVFEFIKCKYECKSDGCDNWECLILTFSVIAKHELIKD